MQKVLKYTIFKTEWGCFGLASVEDALCRTCLPLSKSEKVKRELLTPDPRPLIPIFDKNLFKALQEQITAYFEGAYVDFSQDIPIDLDGFSPFCRDVLFACRGIKFGRVMTYSGLAKMTGRPKTARAVGNALARNPLSLIIPCHRVVCKVGIGGFSAPGGISVKKRLLEHELVRA
jgi:methylated-DNA-[protein]-cysteine S-methyltransferase